MPLERPKRFMAVAAHPDDVEMAMGATFAKWTSSGSEGFILIVTKGEKGGRRTDLASDALAAQREREQRAAAKVLGAKDVRFLGKPDGELVYDLDLLGEIVHWIRTWQPDLVMTHDPTVTFLPWREINHMDHRVVGELALQAHRCARGKLIYPEQLGHGRLKTHTFPDYLLWDASEPDHFEDVTDFMDRKAEAVACHATQFPDIGPPREWLNRWAASIGGPHGMQRAEAFRHLNLRPVF